MKKKKVAVSLKEIIIIVILLSVVLNIFIVYKVSSNNLKLSNSLNIVGRSNKSEVQTEIFSLLKQFITHFNLADYEKIESLWIIKDFENANCPYPTSKKVFNIVKNSEHVVFQYGYEDKLNETKMSKDSFSNVNLYSFTLNKHDNAVIVIETDKMTYISLAIIKDDNDLHKIESIKVSNNLGLKSKSATE